MVRPGLPSRYTSQIILHGTVDGSLRRGGLHKSWRDNIKEWTGQSMLSLLCIADRNRWVTSAAEASVGVPKDGWASRVLDNSQIAVQQYADDRWLRTTIFYLHKNVVSNAQEDIIGFWASSSSFDSTLGQQNAVNEKFGLAKLFRYVDIVVHAKHFRQLGLWQVLKKDKEE